MLKKASALWSSEEEKTDELKDDSGYAYRVLGVQRGSPLSKHGLVPWFDFIVAVGAKRLVAANLVEWDEQALPDTIKAHEGESLRLVVLNTKNGSLRNLVFTPNKDWSKGEKGLTGLNLSYDMFADTMKHVVRVLEVQPHSPAHQAGLQSYTDYLLGTVSGIPFRNSADLIKCVRENQNKPLGLFVYSSVGDTVRILRITPSNNWAGDGLLGCDIGIGQNHNIPIDCRETLGAFRPSRFRADTAEEDDDLVMQVTARPTSARVLKCEVSTDLGYGQILATLPSEGAVVVELDWKLENGASAIYFCRSHKQQTLPDLSASS